MISVNDFFCGAGGMGLGFKNAGFRLAGAWDFDKYAVESYGNNVSPKVKLADIKEMKGDDVPYADVWTFGFPCQDISIAGKKAGMVKGETRSGLFYEVMRLLDEVQYKPKIIMAENVKAVKKYLPTIEEEYKEQGYKLYYTLYNSKYWGVPQNRERYFMVGVHENIEKEFKFPEQQTDFIPKLSSILEYQVDEKFYISNEKATKVIEQAKQRVDLNGTHDCITPDRVEKRQNGRRAKEDEQEMYTLTAQDLHGVIVDDTFGFYKDNPRFLDISPTLRAGRSGLKTIEPKTDVIDVVGRLDIKGQDNIKRVYNPEGIAPTLTTSEGGNRQPKILVAGSLKPDNAKRIGTRDEVWNSEGIAGKLNASDYKQPRPVLHDYRVRKLTPREYARLQGFPDSFKFVVSNTQLYKQFGNAVTVNVAEAIAKGIKRFLEGEM